MSVNVDVAGGWAPEATRRGRRKRPLRPGKDPFYQPPAGFESTAPGTILRTRPVEIALFGLIPQKVSAWQLLYRSSDLHLEPEVAVTTVLLPTGADPGRSRPLLAYQCAIDAIAEQCFPSYALQRGARAFGAIPQFELFVVATALRRGWAVSIADHGGRAGVFGAPREPGYRVLDGVRAALSFPRLGLDADTPVAVCGYSGGGMASSWVAEIAPEYAPELDIVGAALGAPVGDPGEAFIRLNGTFHAGLPVTVIAAIRHIYPDLDRLIRRHTNAAGLRRLDAIEKLDTVRAVVRYAYDDLDKYTDVPLADLLASREVLDVFDDVRLGMRVPACPLLVVQPVHDQIIAVHDVDGQVQRYRDAGVHVTYLRDRLSEHISLMLLSTPVVLNWLGDRLGGRPTAEARTSTVWSTALSPDGIRGLASVASTAARLLLSRPLNGRPRHLQTRRARKSRVAA